MLTTEEAREMAKASEAYRVTRDLINPYEGYTLVWLVQLGDGSYGASYRTPGGSGYGGQGPTPLAAMESAIAGIEQYLAYRARKAS